MPRRRTAPRPFGLLALLVFAAACGGGEAPVDAPPSVTRSDSAGVEIVVVRLDGAPAEWVRLDSTPAVRIGTLDGPEPTRFGTIRGLVARSDGGVVVAEGQSQELRAFDGAGTPLWTAGGIGDGPGEFARIASVGPFSGDSVVVFDDRSGRLSFVAPDGTVGRTAPLPWEDRPFRLTASRGGTLLARIFHFPGPENLPGEGDGGAFRRDSVSFRWATADGEPGATLPGPIPDMEALVQVHSSAEMVAVEARPSPWSRYAHDAAAPGGAWVAVSDAFALHWYDGAGSLRRIVRIPGLEVDFGPADVEAARTALLADAETPAAQRGIDDLLAALPHPATRPAFSGLRMDPAGRLWVLSWTVGDAAPDRAWVVEPDGTFLGEVALPPGVRLEAVGDGVVWGVELDDFDVPAVVGYAFGSTPRR